MPEAPVRVQPAGKLVIVFSSKEHDLPRPVQAVPQALQEQCHFRVTAHEWREASGARHLQATLRCTLPQDTIDLERCRQVGMQPDQMHARYIDVGTAAMNMLLVAQEVGLGACPVTSFRQRGVSIMIELPDTLVPELMVILGHPRPAHRQLRTGALTRLTVDDLTLVARFDGGPRRGMPGTAVE